MANHDEKAPITNLAEALEFLDKLEKGQTSAPLQKIEGEEANGGGSHENALTAKEKFLAKKESIDKAKKELEDLEKSLSDEDREELNSDTEGKNGGSTEEINLEKSLIQMANVLQKSNDRTEKLEKSFVSEMQNLKSLVGDIPLGRRSAKNTNTLKKGFSDAGEDENIGNATLNLEIPLQKSFVSNLLMKKFTETNDDQYSNAIMSLESSGYLSDSMKKSLGAENNITIL